MSTAWTWYYAIPTDLAVAQGRTVESDWLDRQKPIDAATRQHLANYMLAPQMNVWGRMMPPDFKAVWFCLWNKQSRRFGPWERQRAL